MPDLNVRSDAVNVERVMEQIRSRIHEKRGVDYTEQQIQELANVKLEKILDPRGVRSDLLEQFLKRQPASQPPEITPEALRTSKLFDSRSAPIRFVRRLLRPILKLFINPAPLAQGLQSGPRDPLLFELIHNLAVEATRLGIEVKNLRMKVESLTGRLEFNERRARTLESAVVYPPSGNETVAPAPAPRPSPPPARNDYYRPPAQTFTGNAPSPSGGSPPPGASAPAGDRPPQGGGAPFVQGDGSGQRSRRRRRRRGRRNGGAPGSPSGSTMASPSGQPNQASAPGVDAAPAPEASRVEPANERPSEPRSQHEPAPDSGSGGHEPDPQ